MTINHAAALPAGFVLHEYRIERILGHGGFGITYLATDTLLRKAVAIKEYLPVEYAHRGAANAVMPRTDRDGDDFGWGLQRFLDEARTLARFRHAHLVPVLRFFEANGTGYMVMEFEDGRSAGDWFRSFDGRISEAQARAFLLPLLDGLETVHSAGYLHRDIKPGNIVIRNNDHPVLIDFGAARQALTSRSLSVTAIVTPRYAPLEQYSSEGEQGPWSDIYALAAVIHTGLTGAPPPEATARVPKDRYRKLVDQLADSYDPRFLAAIDWALNLFPADRPRSVAQWRQALHQGAPAGVSGDAPTMLAREADTAMAGLSAHERPVPEIKAAAPKAKGATRIAVAAVLLLAATAAVWTQRQAIWPPQPIDPQPTGPIATGDNNPPKPPVVTPPVTNPPVTPRLPRVDAIAAQATADAVAKAQERVEQAKAAAERADREAAEAREAAEKARGRAGEATAIVQSGVGLLELADGGKYAGEIEGGRRHGYGVTTYPSGDRLEGQWKNGLVNGAAVFIWSDGRSYLGEWAAGVQQGYGVLQYPDGGRYGGQWASDQPHGLGIALRGDGGQSAGEWSAGKLSGYAIERLADGGRYEGQFIAGKPSGRGVRTATDGKRQAGEWFEGALSRPD